MDYHVLQWRECGVYHADSGNFLQGMTNDVAVLLGSYSKIVMLVVVYSQH